MEEVGEVRAVIPQPRMGAGEEYGKANKESSSPGTSNNHNHTLLFEGRAMKGAL